MSTGEEHAKASAHHSARKRSDADNAARFVDLAAPIGEPPTETREGRARRGDYEVVGSAEVEAGATERLTFFSDAVAAIALTLLAIELPVPEGETGHEFWLSVKSNWTEYLAFLISFGVISAHWANHHKVFRFIGRADARIRQLNLYWLFAIVVIPFATGVITENKGWEHDESTPIRFAFYSAVQLIANGAMVVLLRRVTAKHLWRADTPRIIVVTSYWQAATMTTGFLLSIPLFFVWRMAWIMWIVTPFIMGFAGRWVLKGQAHKLGFDQKR